jgi:VWFA-related protein
MYWDAPQRRFGASNPLKTRGKIDYQKHQVPNFMPLQCFFRSTTLASLLLLMNPSSVLLRAQDVQMVPDAQDKESAAQAEKDRDKDPDQAPITTFKANVDVVQFFFNVKDKKGGIVANLPKENFELFEDGKPQTIKYFTSESNLPLTLGILIDGSASQERVLGMEKDAGAAFLSQILRDKDMAFVMSFDIGVELLQDFTANQHRLKAALDSVKINSGGHAYLPDIPGMGGGPVPQSGDPKGTLLYDAVYLASHDEMAQQVDRKAMIMLTDGEDQGSQYKIRDAIEEAQKADTIVYVLLCADRAVYGFGGYSGDSEMKKLTEATGGRVIEVGNKPEKLKAAFEQISQELRTQYGIGYVPTNPTKDGKFRKVEIRSKDGSKVQSRSGYFAVAIQ